MSDEPTFAGFRLSEQGQCLLDAQDNEHFLRPQCLATFRHLARHHDRIVSRQELMDVVWPDVIVNDGSLTKCISEIRHALGDTDRNILQTHAKFGYRLVADAISPADHESSTEPARAFQAEHRGADDDSRTRALHSLRAHALIPAFLRESTVSRRFLLTAGLLTAGLVCVLLWQAPQAPDTDDQASALAVTPRQPGQPLSDDWRNQQSQASGTEPGPAASVPVQESDAPGWPVIDADAIIARPHTTSLEPVSLSNYDMPALHVSRIVAPGSSTRAQRLIRSLQAELAVSLSRYRYLHLVEEQQQALFHVTLSSAGGVRAMQATDDVSPGSSAHDSAETNRGPAPNLLDVVHLTLRDELTGQTLFAESIDIPDGTADLRRIAGSMASMIASPGGGALGRYLLDRAYKTPVEQLGRAECYAFAFECNACRGSMDTIVEKALQCLDQTLRHHPEDALSWSLLAAVRSHQWEFGSALPEPLRSNMASRRFLREQARLAANRAEQFGNTDATAHYGMAKAYVASCDREALRSTAYAGLRLAPDDAGLLGTFGNWLAYAGFWQEGEDMARKAVELQPRHFQKWWLWAVAKHHYVRGDYQEALDVFLQAFEDRNWISHLQLAYTYPRLGQMEKAHQALERLQQLMPGMTLERALQFYDSYCFQDDYLQKMREALVMAGMPSRGVIHDLHDIDIPTPTLIEIMNRPTEILDMGEGSAVLFVHGEMSDYRAWSFQQNAVSEQYRHIAYSRSYYGSQPWPDDGEGYSIEHYADELIGVIEQLESGPVHVVGWSSSGNPVLRAQLKRPDLFASSTLFEPMVSSLLPSQAIEKADPTVKKAWHHFSSRLKQTAAHAARGEHEDALRSLLDAVFQMPSGALEMQIPPVQRMFLDNSRTVALYFRSLPSPASEPELDCDALSQIRVPTQVIVGAQTDAYRQTLFNTLSDCLANSRYRLLPDANHDGPIRNPDAFNEMLLDFIDRHESGEVSSTGER